MTKVGLIGCGRVAWEGHVPSYRAMSEVVQIAAISDASEERLEFFRRELGMKKEDCYKDYQELLKREDIDFVDIATPPSIHREIVVAAAQARKHVLCEKPIATTLQAVDEMIESARRYNIHLGAFHNYFFFPREVRAREIIRSGIIGQVRFSCINALAIGYYSGAKEFNPVWRSNPQYSGGGVLIDYGTHPVYTTLSYFDGQDIRSVTAFIGNRQGEENRVEDRASCIFKFDTGEGVVHTSWGVGTAGGAYIVGDKGTLEINVPELASQKVQLRIEAYDSVEVFELPKDSFSWFFGGSIKDFVASISEGHEPSVVAEDGRRSLEAILASYKSAYLGESVGLPLAKTDPIYIHGIHGLRELGVTKKGACQGD